MLNDLDDVTFDGDGRTDRASLHDTVTLAKGQQLTDATDALRLDTSRDNTQKGRSNVLTGTDAQIVRPYTAQ